jgi:hypothetical protein
MTERIIKTSCGHKFIVIDETRKVLKVHSMSGPAAIYPDGTEEYYIHGLKYDKLTWESLVKQSKRLFKED